jgi:hypothetical protein
LSTQLFSPLREADTSFPSSQAGYSITKEVRRVSEVRPHMGFLVLLGG